MDNRSTEELNNKKRFEYELDFLQSLANPYYIKYLAQNKYFRNKSMIHFLEYLQYWKQTPYIKYIKYPACLFYLEKLQHEEFRKLCEIPSQMDQIIIQHECHFKYYKINRTPLVPNVINDQNLNQNEIEKNDN